MVSRPDNLAQSPDNHSADSQNTYQVQTPNFTNERFAPSASRTADHPNQNTSSIAAARETSAQILEQLGFSRLDIIDVNQSVTFAPIAGFDDTPATFNDADVKTAVENLNGKQSPEDKPVDLTLSSNPTKPKPESIDYPGGKHRKLTWEGDELTSMTGADGKKWEHVKKDGKFVDEWSDPTGSIWKGKMELDRSTNDFSITDSNWPKSSNKIIFRASGDKETFSADGSRSIDFANNDSVTFNKDQLMTSFKSADGITRHFSEFKSFNVAGDMVPTKIKVVTPATTTAAATVTNWTMNAAQSWRCDGTAQENSTFKIDSKKGTYGFENFDTGVEKTFVPGKYIEVSESEGGASYLKRDHADGTKSVSKSDKSWTVNISNDLATRYENNGEVREITRDEKGNVTSFSDTTSNRQWSRNDKNEWSAKPIDESKPYAPPAVPNFSGEVLIDARGLTLLKGKDGSFKTLDMNGELRNSSKSETLRGLAASSANIHRPGQARFAESINNFMERSGISDAEKDNTIDQITRLMTSTKGGPFTAVDKQALAAQLSWHLARPYRQEQGQNNTCNVTSIRESLISDSPAAFAKMIADVGTTGQFITADGSTIRPTVEGMNFKAGDLKFPPASGDRSWLGQIADHTMVNIHWQRATKDTFGYAVNKGELTYTQIPNTGDSGERIQRIQNGKVMYALKNKCDQYLATGPSILTSELADIYGQITGKDESKRIVASVNAMTKDDKHGVQVANENEFEAQMQKGPWPKIVAVHTSRDPFWTESGSGTAGGAGGRTGGWHVVVAHMYEPKSGKVSVDNSWQANLDHMTWSRQIGVKQLWAAASGAVPAK